MRYDSGKRYHIFFVDKFRGQRGPAGSFCVCYLMPEKSLAAYHNSSGEVEANNVMNRLHMTPEERMLTSPWKTQDVPNEQQIVRFGNEGVQESRNALGGQSIDPARRAEIQKWLKDQGIK